MARLHDEKDVNLLRQAVCLLERENAKLVQQVLKLNLQLAEAKGESAEQVQLRIAALEAVLNDHRKRLFGDSSERRSRDGDDADKDKKKRKKKTGHGPRSQPQLRLIEEVIEIDLRSCSCPVCGGGLELWEGQYEESEEISVVVREFVRKVNRRQKARCQCGACIITAPLPNKLFDGARYSIEFAIEAAVGKYLDHLPLERMVRIMGREGLTIDSQTLWDQLNALARVLSKAYEALTRYIRTKDVLAVDETHWKVLGPGGKLHTSNKRWQTWAAATDDAVVYQIHPSRSADAAEELLGDYAGAIICDGYSGYTALAKRRPNLVLAHCWVHVRREMLKAEPTAPESIGEVLELIGKLYQIEKRCPTGPPGEVQRRALRDTESRQVVRAIQQWALAVDALPQSPLGKARAYMAGRWSGLTRFLDDPRIPLDSNSVERSLRGVVLGRKNHYGSRSKRGTEVAALFYSLLESAKLAGVEPKGYLRAAVDAALHGDPIPLPHELAARQRHDGDSPSDVVRASADAEAAGLQATV